MPLSAAITKDSQKGHLSSFVGSQSCFVVFLCVLSLLFLSSCGFSVGGHSSSTATITISPVNSSIQSGSTQQYTAVVSNTSNSATTWSASGGSISSTGLFTPPVVSQKTTFTVTATSVADPTVSASTSITVMVASTHAATIPSTFFGIESLPPGSNGGTTYPSALSFGTYRLFNPERGMGWNSQNPTNGSYNWSILDTALANLFSHNITDGVVYTIAAVPSWASSKPTDTNCDFLAPGGCDLPGDIASDGSGTDGTYITFIRALASHVNDPTYLLTHAHIKYYEPWNEWYRNPVLGTMYATCESGTGRCSIHATYAQMVRMTEDLRCAVTGTGTVDGSPCAYSAIDATARILTPGSDGSSYGAAVLEDFLHCDSSPYAGSLCTTGDRGRNAVDALNFHLYVSGLPAEDVVTQVAQIKSVLNSADLAVPLWSGEGGWLGDSTLSDPDQQAAFVARYYLLGWSAGLSGMTWYEFENPVYGTLCTPQANCTLNAAGIAYRQVYSWMVGNVLSSCSATGTIYTCPIAKPDGTQMLAMWDTSQSCSNGVCSTVELAVDPKYTQYRDLLGNMASIPNSTIPIGAKPILLN